MNAVHYSSEFGGWRTPDDFGDSALVFDVCATPGHNFLGLPYLFPFDPVCYPAWAAVCNALSYDSWEAFIEGGYGWMNPPYGRGIDGWVARAARTAQRGAGMVCLLPARTDTAWWHNYIWEDAKPVPTWREGVRGKLLRGRIKFLDEAGLSRHPAPFPSALIVFEPRTP